MHTIATEKLPSSAILVVPSSVVYVLWVVSAGEVSLAHHNVPARRFEMVRKSAAVEPSEVLIVQVENAQLEVDGPTSSIAVDHESKCHDGVQEVPRNHEEGGRRVDQVRGTQAGELKERRAIPETVVTGRSKLMIVGEVAVHLDVADQAPVRTEGQQSEMPLVDAKDVEVVVDLCIWRSTAADGII